MLRSVAPKSYRTAVVWIVLLAVVVMLSRIFIYVWNINYAVANFARWTLNSDAGRSTRVENAHLVRDQLESVLLSEGIHSQDLRLEVYRSFLNNYLAVSLAETNLLAADKLFSEGMTQQTAGRLREAITTFEQAITKNPRLVVAYPHLYAAYQASSWRFEANRLYSQLHALSPSNEIDESDQNGRRVPVPFVELTPGVRFIGYDLLASALPYSRAPPVTLYWEVDVCEADQAIRSWEADGWLWVSAGSRLYQVGTVENLAPNPGFEMLVLPNHEGYIPGWRPFSPPARAEIVLNENKAPLTNELQLTSLGSQSTLWTRSQPLAKDNAWYLLTGSMSSEPGVWSCVALDYDVGAGWSFPFCGTGLDNNNKRRIRRALLIQPRADEADATWFNLILVNFSDHGSAWYDDLLFAPIDLPNLETVASHCL